MVSFKEAYGSVADVLLGGKIYITRRGTFGYTLNYMCVHVPRARDWPKGVGYLVLKLDGLRSS